MWDGLLKVVVNYRMKFIVDPRNRGALPLVTVRTAAFVATLAAAVFLVYVLFVPQPSPYGAGLAGLRMVARGASVAVPMPAPSPQLRERLGPGAEAGAFVWVVAFVLSVLFLTFLRALADWLFRILHPVRVEPGDDCYH